MAISHLQGIRGHVAHERERLTANIALASSIMPIPSDISTTTSLTASPIDSNDQAHYHAQYATGRNDRDEGDKADQGAIGHQKKKEERPTIPHEVQFDIHMHGNSFSPETEICHIHQSPEISNCQNQIAWQTLVEEAEKEGYERRRLVRLQQDVERKTFAQGLEDRLQATASISYGNMIDQFKGDDQAGFTGLFEASERLSKRCINSLAMTPSSYQETETTFPGARTTPDEASQLDAVAMEPILSFLDRLRTDLDYLSDLISNLPSSELSSLTSSYHPAGVDLSVLPNHSHGKTDVFSRDSQMMKLSRRMDNIDCFHTRDPYFVLLHTIFNPWAGPISRERRTRREVWARTCAKIATDRSDGSEEFVIATIDSFASFDEWTLRDDLDLYISNVITEGWFILDPPDDDSVENSGYHWEPERASHAIAVAEFFDRQSEALLGILAGSIDRLLPEDCIAFIRSILSHVGDQQMQDLLQKFIVSRWFFASFITSLLVYPEVNQRHQAQLHG